MSSVYVIYSVIDTIDTNLDSKIYMCMYMHTTYIWFED